jgi:hypothetical protein
MYSELEMIWNESVVTKFKVISQHLHEVTEENYEKP